ncbi:hypothetical protein ESCO_002173 [Escovopsis weberi]|uniref:Amine oxidase domain-containing protein n=1 Tax=Escovopsis weberi TaxID=150374 RepID=A0A0N0RTZ5_ESCWE|nr:hypothetical protein ESCO_002173 [Escovopsis weberi]
MSRPIDRFPRKKVAIIGSGCSGIAALWALNRTYHDVYLYEASDRLGGHTNTVQWRVGKYTTAVDAGFVILNSSTYPNFLNFLNKVGVQTEPTDLSFAVSRDQGMFEWAYRNLNTIFCQRSNLFSPRMWRTLFDIFRFNQFALDLLDNEDDFESYRAGNDPIRGGGGALETIGEYLEREGYSDGFRDDYLIPLTASVWTTSPDKCVLEFPASTLVRFLWNHHLLSITNRHSRWLTLKDGARSYIDAVMKGFPPNHLFLNTGVRYVTNDAHGLVLVHLENGRKDVYDHVIIATQGDQALSMLGPQATELERSILSCFQTSQNEVFLHSDTSLMPQSKKAWSSWNFLTMSYPSLRKANMDKVCVTYNMNMLQHIPRYPFGHVLVTLNPVQRPSPTKTQGRFFYTHPRFTSAAVRAQRRLPSIQNKRGISFAGAWTKYGFHEDAFSSGLQVAQDHLGALLPFEYKDATYSRGRIPRLGLTAHLLRFLILIVQVFVVQVVERLVGTGRQKVVKPIMNGLPGKRPRRKMT